MLNVMKKLNVAELVGALCVLCLGVAVIVLGFALRCDGTKTDLLYVDGGPASTGTVGHLRMAGNQVFRHAVVNIAEGITAACAASWPSS